MKRYLEIERIVYQELEKNCFGNKKRQGYRHLFGVSTLCIAYSQYVQLDCELCAIMGLLHDYSVYKNNTSFNHAQLSSELARKMLEESLLFENEEIDIEKFKLGTLIDTIKKFNTGLVLITGKVNSGKSTTLNAYVQSINKEKSKKIVMLEEPIEHRHTSDKCIIVQKEVGKTGDVPSYYDGVINLLREDSDIAIVGEIRDRQTMDAVLDLAESGTLVIGTLHTRSCGETLDRILGLYSPSEQKSIKYILSTVLKAIVSQKLVKDKNEHIILVPEIMITNSTIAALIRQENFSISEIQDAIDIKSEKGMISFERSFAKLYKDGIISLESIRENVEDDRYDYIMRLIGGDI